MFRRIRDHVTCQIQTWALVVLFFFNFSAAGETVNWLVSVDYGCGQQYDSLKSRVEQYQQLTGVNVVINCHSQTDMRHIYCVDLLGQPRECSPNGGQYVVHENAVHQDLVYGTWNFDMYLLWSEGVPLNQIYNEDLLMDMQPETAASEVLWTQIAYVLWESFAVWGTHIYGLPYDADWFTILVHSAVDLPGVATWEEVYDEALRLEGQDFNADGVVDFPICLHFEYHAPSLWFIAASFLQYEGRDHGFRFDPYTMSPLVNTTGMHAAIAIYQQFLGKANVVATTPELNALWMAGRCGIILGQFTGLMYLEGSSTLMAGSSSVYDRTLGAMVPCTSALCPWAQAHPSGDGRVVNTVASVFGGSQFVIDKRSVVKKQAYDFAAWMVHSAQSNEDLGILCDPFMEQHFDWNVWQAAMQKRMALQANSPVKLPSSTPSEETLRLGWRQLNSENVALDFVPSYGTGAISIEPYRQYIGIDKELVTKWSVGMFANMSIPVFAQTWATAYDAATDAVGRATVVEQYRRFLKLPLLFTGECPVGYYHTKLQSDWCNPCPLGTMWELESSSEPGTTVGFCRQCDKGSYSQSKGMLSCLECPSDYTTAAPGSTDKSACSVPEWYNSPLFPARTPVDVTMQILRMFNIDGDVSQAKALLNIVLDYPETRLNFTGIFTNVPDTMDATSAQVVVGGSAREFWIPGITLADMLPLDQGSVASQSITVAPGRVQINWNVTLTINTIFNWRPYPFDWQDIIFVVKPVQISDVDLDWASLDEKDSEANWIGITKDAEDDWPLAWTIEDSYRENLEGDVMDSTVSMSIRVLRLIDQMAWRYILPSQFLLLLCYSSLFITSFDTRVSASFTTFLIIAEFMNGVFDVIPNTVAYSTWADTYIFCCMTFMILICLSNVYSMHINKHKSSMLSEEADEACKIAFPCLLVALLIVLFTHTNRSEQSMLTWYTIASFLMFGILLSLWMILKIQQFPYDLTIRMVRVVNAKIKRGHDVERWEPDVNEMHALFNAIDVDKSGSIDTEELVYLLHSALRLDDNTTRSIYLQLSQQGLGAELGFDDFSTQYHDLMVKVVHMINMPKVIQKRWTVLRFKDRLFSPKDEITLVDLLPRSVSIEKTTSANRPRIKSDGESRQGSLRKSREIDIPEVVVEAGAEWGMVPRNSAIRTRERGGTFTSMDVQVGRLGEVGQDSTIESVNSDESAAAGNAERGKPATQGGSPLLIPPDTNVKEEKNPPSLAKVYQEPGARKARASVAIGRCWRKVCALSK
ncbi:hypothetical protein CYMTET_19912 [Cymbomonas tetramitiformis]|uniref:EF-hand domain-containing protein n=1 Tax=Cymbomonas tetramitiformis TaxID=36881 RepID=A0AAE0L4P9_9CHLO|nr:hypothetical protein CYMTET_19912 [Cymbomonas tetramitiformis]